MRTRFMATTALALSLALPAAAGAGQATGIQQGTKVEQRASASVSTELLNDAKAQLHSATTALEGVKDAAGEKFVAAREKARTAIQKLEAALENAKAEIAETSRDAMAATRDRIAEARELIEDQRSKPQDIASSLGAVGESAGNVELGAAHSSDSGMSGSAGGKAKAESDTGVVAKVGSALGLSADADTASSAKLSAGTDGWQKVELVGETVYGADQEVVGEIDDVVMTAGGKVESVLVDVGGFLGIGAKRVAIPVASLEVQGGTVVAASLTKEQAEAMPEYKRQQ